jgi:hypothetical protein
MILEKQRSGLPRIRRGKLQCRLTPSLPGNLLRSKGLGCLGDSCFRRNDKHCFGFFLKYRYCNSPLSGRIGLSYKTKANPIVIPLEGNCDSYLRIKQTALFIQALPTIKNFLLISLKASCGFGYGFRLAVGRYRCRWRSRRHPSAPDSARLAVFAKPMAPPSAPVHYKHSALPDPSLIIDN